MILEFKDDLDLKKTADSGQCFRIRRFDDGAYRFITEGSVLYIRERAPERFEADCAPEEWDAVWASYFDLGRSYAAIRASIPAGDACLRRAAERSSCRPVPTMCTASC